MILWKKESAGGKVKGKLSHKQGERVLFFPQTWQKQSFDGCLCAFFLFFLNNAIMNLISNMVKSSNWYTKNTISSRFWSVKAAWRNFSAWNQKWHLNIKNSLVLLKKEQIILGGECTLNALLLFYLSTVFQSKILEQSVTYLQWWPKSCSNTIFSLMSRCIFIILKFGGNVVEQLLLTFRCQKHRNKK